MKQETLFVAFSTQKGGMGKTALTVLSASYLHYVKGYNVAVIDCDYPQHSIVEMRERDVEQVKNNLYYKKLAYMQFKTLQKKAYRIEESNAADAISVAEGLAQENELDFIFFDLPGTLNTKGVVKTLAMMDYVFIPVSADRVVLESTLQFATTIHDNLITTGKSNIKDLFLIWNMVDGRKRKKTHNRPHRPKLPEKTASASVNCRTMKVCLSANRPLRRVWAKRFISARNTTTAF
jgi:cellulose biosynthesis protein BcsQ